MKIPVSSILIICGTVMTLDGCATAPVRSEPGRAQKQEGYVRTADGTRLFFRTIGTRGDTLVFLHGGPGQNSEGVGPDLEALADSHVLLLYDQRGSGRSEAGPDTLRLTAATHVRDLEEVRAFFGLTQLTLVGHSWGGMLAALYTVEHSAHVKRLLLLAPGPPTRRMSDQRFAAFARRDSIGQAEVVRLRAGLESARDPIEVCRRIASLNEALYYADGANRRLRRGDYCAVPAESFRKQAITARVTLRSLGDWDLRPILAKISVPTLIVEGAATPVPMQELETWAASIPGARLWLVPKVGHAYPFVEQATLFFRETERFLNGGWPADAQRVTQATPR